MAEDHPALPAGQFTPPTIVYVPIGTLMVYHITEQELDLIERGAPESTYFGFAVFLLSTGFSFLIALLTAGIQSQRLFNIFLIVTLFGLVGGLLLFIVWLRLQRSTVSITKVIRSRKPSAGQQRP